MVSSDYLLESYADIKQEADFEYKYDYDLQLTSLESNISVLNQNYISGHGVPQCKPGETITNWLNPHTENGHYHTFLVSKPETSGKGLTKIRLFHMEDYYHTIEYKLESEYCLDSVFALSLIHISEPTRPY